MNLLSFLSSKKVDEFARTLAREFSKSCPVAGSNKKKPEVEKQVKKALDGVFEQTRGFREKERLGVFARARLAKIFQDEMMTLGYEPELVSRVTTALVTNALSAK